MSDVTVIGLGAMGSALAETFLARGLQVTVWNRSPERAEPLVAKGAAKAGSPGEAIRASQLVVVSVLDYQAVREILESAKDGLDDRTLVNLTNGTPGQARELAVWADRHGARYVDGAVMVTPEMVGGPEAFLLYSGTHAAYLAHEDTLAKLGSGTWVGTDAGLGALYDLALLSAMFGMFGGYLHAAALLRSETIPVAEVTPTIMELLKAMIALLPQTASEIDSGVYPQPTSNNAMMAAGLRNIVDGSREQHVRADLMEPLRALFERAAAEGLGERDISALVPLLAPVGRP